MENNFFGCNQIKKKSSLLGCAIQINKYEFSQFPGQPFKTAVLSMDNMKGKHQWSILLFIILAG